MKTIKELTSNIKKNAIGIHNGRSRNWRAKEDADKVIRFALGVAHHYGKVLGYTPEEVLNVLEKLRSVWTLNYYQKAWFPRLTTTTAIRSVKIQHLQQLLEEQRQNNEKLSSSTISNGSSS